VVAQVLVKVGQHPWLKLVVLVVPLVKQSIKMATLSHGQVVTIQLM
jgi:hypothetical protein